MQNLFLIDTNRFLFKIQIQFMSTVLFVSLEHPQYSFDLNSRNLISLLGKDSPNVLTKFWKML